MLNFKLKHRRAKKAFHPEDLVTCTGEQEISATYWRLMGELAYMTFIVLPVTCHDITSS